MLSSNIYLNTLYMMSHRGFDQSNDLIDSLSKEPKTKYITDDKYTSIGFDFSLYMRPDFKDYEGMYSMSYLLTNETKKEKQFVIFGNGNKSFLTIVINIMINILNNPDEYEYGFNLVVVKDFRSDYLHKITRISSKIKVNIFLDIFFEKPPFHAYGSRISLMTEDEVNLFLKETHITKIQMKKISKDDPMIKYFGYDKGSVVRIHRTPMIPGSLVHNTIDIKLIV